MFFKIDSFALIGIEALKVDIEVHMTSGLPGCSIVGLPGKAVNESITRVRSAIINSGFDYPLKRITVNLSPANIKKDGSFYDLPIALAILAASGQLNTPIFNNSCFVGELSLNGRVNPVNGLISMAEKALSIRKEFFFVPFDIAIQASYIREIKIIPCRNLKEIVQDINKPEILETKIYVNKNPGFTEKVNYKYDFSDIKGQAKAKRAIQVAVSGMHNIIMAGPPGSGKTLLAKSAVSIMPDLEFDECIEVTKIHSISQSFSSNLLFKRPFKNPHHTISRTGLIGGGANPKPGEISLAHKGILFLDEFSQFPKNIIEDLRQPLEDREITITRNQFSCCFPCSFMLIIATNPCQCGYYGDSRKECICSQRDIRGFWKKFSGPILDRIDIRINIPRMEKEHFINFTSEKGSEELREEVSKCMIVQAKRYINKKIKYNSEADINILNNWISCRKELDNLIIEAAKKYELTSRGIASIIKVARTIADMENSQDIEDRHFLEALNYRSGFDEKYFDSI